MKLKLGIRQEDAIRAGGNRHGAVEVEVDMESLSDEQRRALLRRGSDRDNVYWLGVALPTQESVVAALDRLVELHREEEEEKRNAHEGAVAELLETPQEEYNTNGDYDYRSPGHCIRDARTDERLRDKEQLRWVWVKAEDERNDRQLEERKAWDQRMRELYKIDQARQEELRAATKDQWIAEHGTPSQQERYAAGMLSEKELEGAMADQVFAAADSWPRYDLLVKSDIPCVCWYEEDRPRATFHSSQKESATAEEWEQKKQLQELLPTAAITLREHVGECRDCDAVVTRGGLLATITLDGGIELSREYELADS